METCLWQLKSGSDRPLASGAHAFVDMCVCLCVGLFLVFLSFFFSLEFFGSVDICVLLASVGLCVVGSVKLVYSQTRQKLISNHSIIINLQSCPHSRYLSVVVVESEREDCRAAANHHFDNRLFCQLFMQ